MTETNKQTNTHKKTLTITIFFTNSLTSHEQQDLFAQAQKVHYNIYVRLTMAVLLV